MSIFRKALLKDFEAIVKLKKEVHEFHFKNEPKFYKNPETLLCIEDFKKELEKNHIYVLENEDGIIGYAFIYDIIVKNDQLIFDQKILFIDDFSISQTQKRKGFGNELFHSIEEYGKQNNYSSIELNVWNFNDDAKKFYEKMEMKTTRIRMKKTI
jgi:diamine N-acetyltransferase